MKGTYRIQVEAQFESAHNLRDYDGACEQIHGHSYKVEVRLHTPIDEKKGYGVDFVALQGRLDELAATLDHRYLNETPPFDEIETTAENLAHWFAEQMNDMVLSSGARYECVRVWEGPLNLAEFWPE